MLFCIICFCSGLYSPSVFGRNVARSNLLHTALSMEDIVPEIPGSDDPLSMPPCTTPVFGLCPSNITVNNAVGTCGATVNYIAFATGSPAPSLSYQFSGATVSSGAGDGSGSSFNVGTTVVELSAINACDTVLCSFAVIVVDTQAPVLNCPANMVVNASPSTCSRALIFAAPVGSDNCPGAMTIRTGGLPSGSTFPVGSTLQSYSITDAHGFSAACSFAIQVVDNQGPILVCPANITVSAGVGSCAATVNFITPVGTDNCTGATTVRTAGQASGSTFSVGTTLETYVSTDLTGNSTSCSFTIVVSDNVAPALTCDANVSVVANIGACGANAVSVTGPSVFDNCGSTSVTNDYNNTADANDAYPLGTTVVVWTATDGNGNTSTCSQTVTVTDAEAPVITCPTAVSMSADAGLCNAVVSGFVATATDNCAGLAFSNDFNANGADASGSFAIGNTSVTFTVTDAGGNSASCTSTVQVDDTEMPTAVCPANITVNNDSNVCGATILFPAPVCWDNCSGISTLCTMGLASGATFPVGTTTEVFLVTDAAGNTTSCTFTATVLDMENPVVVCPSNMTAFTDPGTATSAVSFSYPVATDNCASVSVVQTSGATSGAYYGVGTTAQTYTATDGSGNTATCMFTILVIDNEAPQLTCPSNLVVNPIGSSCDAVVNFAAPIGTDNCPGATTVQSAGLLSGATFQLGTTTQVYVCTDSSGNSTVCMFMVEVQDNQAPTIAYCPVNINLIANYLPCTAIGNWIPPTVSDNCSAVTMSSNYLSGATFPAGATTVTYSALDGAGNTAVCSFTVTVHCPTLSTSISANTLPCGTHLACHGDQNGIATVAANGGVQPYSCVWSNGDTTAMATGLSAGSWTVSVTDALGTVHLDSIVITEPSPIQLAAIGSDSTCTGANTGFVDLTSSGGAACNGYSYEWTNAGVIVGATEDLSGLPNDAYDVLVTDANGCHATTSIAVATFDGAAADLGADTLICAGDALVLNPGTFAQALWSTGDTTSTILLNTAGTYWFEGHSVGGCVAHDTVTVSVHTLADPHVRSVGPATICLGDTLTLESDLGFASYLWSNGAVGATAQAQTGGNYTLAVTDGTGCTRLDSLAVTFINHEDPHPVISATNTVICGGSPEVLDAGAGFSSYLWNTGATTQQLTVYQSGNYEVLVHNGFGCSESAQAVHLSANASYTPVVNMVGNGLMSSSAATYQWYEGATLLIGETYQTLVPTASGNYSVFARNAAGCAGTSSYLYFSVGVEAEAADEIGLEYYPNPNSGVLYLHAMTPLFKPVSVEVCDMQGKVLQRFDFPSLLGEVELDVRDLAAGVYIFRTATSKGTENNRIVISK
jgi:hypothetical protein